MVAREDGELPEAYGRSRVVVLPIDPFHVHVYWEITPEDRLGAAQKLGGIEERPPVWTLRFHDVTSVDPDPGSAHRHFDVDVELESKNWYVDLWAADKRYFVELGVRSGDRFAAVCRSGPVEVPRAEPSPAYDPTWGTMPTAAAGQSPAPRLVPADPPEVAPAPEDVSVEKPVSPLGSDVFSAEGSGPMAVEEGAPVHRGSNAARNGGANVESTRVPEPERRSQPVPSRSVSLSAVSGSGSAGREGERR